MYKNDKTHNLVQPYTRTGLIEIVNEIIKQGKDVCNYLLTKIINGKCKQSPKHHILDLIQILIEVALLPFLSVLRVAYKRPYTI